MENFIVSARKYRPATFETVVGQLHITNTLKNAIKNNQLAQAFLFCGPRGVGKTTCARILAKTINCEHLSADTEACGVCNSCVSFQNNASFSVHELDAASNNSVDDIRGLIEQVRIPPQSGKFKVYIIDEVHMLSQSAFNAFLKTLEEPPHYAIFILATTEKHKILPTILSRCQIFDFNRIQVEDIAQHLAKIAHTESIPFEENALHIIAQKADGGLRDALSMFDQIVSFSNKNLTYKAVIENLNLLDYDYFFKITDFIVNGATSDCLLTFNEILSHGFDGNHFITGLASHFRDLLVAKDSSTISLLEVSEGIKQKYLQQSKITDVSFLISAINMANQCDINYKNSNNQRLQVELTLLKLGHLQHAINLSKKPLVTLSADEIKKKTNILKESSPEYITSKKSSPVEEINPMPTAPITLQTSINEEEVVKPTETKAKKRIPSIKDLNTLPKDDKIALKIVDGIEEQAFSESEFLTYWNQFAEALKKKGKTNQYHLMSARVPKLQETAITVYLDNPAQTYFFQEIKVELTNFLRTKLHHFKIAISTETIKFHTEKIIYTSKEKYDYLVKLNPVLNSLIKTFDLDVK